MGLIQLEINIPAAGGTNTKTRSLDPGILHAVSVNSVTPLVPKGQTLARVTLRRGGADESWTGVTLVNEYVYHNFSPTWHGLIYLESHDVLHYYIITTAADHVWCAALTTRFLQVTTGGQVVDIRPSMISV